MVSLVCFAAQAEDVLDTNLGELGNQWVSQTFRQYKAKAKGCLPSGGSERRILLQGFGPFQGVSRNLSGAVVASLSGLSDLPQTAHGGWATTRKLVVEGETIEFCFVYVDVVWDLAGAILLTEIERFNPQVVMMSGIGNATAIVEAGAQNSATSLSGFDAEGNPLRDTNTPWCKDKPCGLSAHTFVLDPDAKGVTPKVPHSWDNQKVADALLDSVRRFAPDITIETPKEARGGNDYLCNNVSYVVQSAINGAEIHLAGGRISFPAKASKQVAGFFHYPYDSNPSEAWVKSWAAALLHALRSLH